MLLGCRVPKITNNILNHAMIPETHVRTPFLVGDTRGAFGPPWTPYCLGFSFPYYLPFPKTNIYLRRGLRTPWTPARFTALKKLRPCSGRNFLKARACRYPFWFGLDTLFSMLGLFLNIIRQSPQTTRRGSRSRNERGKSRGSHSRPNNRTLNRGRG